MFCPECGFDADESRFCPDCGSSLDKYRTVASQEELQSDESDVYDDEENDEEYAEDEKYDDEEYDDEEYVEEAVISARTAPRRAPRRTDPRGGRRRPNRQARAQQSLAARSARTRAATPAAKPSHLSPAVIWMSCATIVVLILISVFAFARTSSGAVGSPSVVTQPSGPVAADTSGSYSVLVQRANGLYDQGAQAIQKSQQSSATQYFAAAAKIYRAAWKKQSSDPNVGTDFATSLFYSGDTKAALKQADVVLAKSPDFQTAHLNKGIYLENAAQTAQQSGKQKRAGSLLAQAKAEFQRAVALDPRSSAGVRAAEDLKSL